MGQDASKNEETWTTLNGKQRKAELIVTVTLYVLLGVVFISQAVFSWPTEATSIVLSALIAAAFAANAVYLAQTGKSLLAFFFGALAAVDALSIILFHF